MRMMISSDEKQLKRVIDTVLHTLFIWGCIAKDIYLQGRRHASV